MDTPFTIIADWFHRYYRSQTVSNGSRAVLMALKYDHSINVSAHTAAIAHDEGWPPDDCQLAEILGLIHDVGRFPQLATYGTFSDIGSIDHGEYGVLTADREGIFGMLPEDATAILRDGIRHHNARTIPSLSPRSRMFLRAVRDADKLDIFRVIDDAVTHNTITDHPEITLNIDIDGPLNPAALTELERQENVSYANVKSLADFGLTQLSWLYDMHYAYTFHHVRDHRIIDTILTIIPPDDRAAGLRRLIDEHTDGR